MSKVWYKYKHFWRRGDNDGDSSPQDRDDGTGDLIFNTLTKILKDQDLSSWAVESFFYCCDLLSSPNRKRYPDEFLTGYETPNMIVFWWKRFWRKQRAKRTTDELPPVLKPQGRMSRDPYIALGTTYAFFMLNIEDEADRMMFSLLFRWVTIPLHLQYSRETMRWWRQLRYDNRKHYVKRLYYFKALGTEYTFLRKDEDDFYKDTL